MKTIAVPIWNGCVANVFDFAETVQMITLEDDRIVSRRDLTLSGAGDLERTNRLIDSKPDVLLCGAISRCVENRICSAGIEVVSLVCGPVDRVLSAYVSGKVTAPEFSLPGCKHRGGQCQHRRRVRRGQQG
jgi:predicted Fe-Mo cluster-binding NifX family protein